MGNIFYFLSLLSRLRPKDATRRDDSIIEAGTVAFILFLTMAFCRFKLMDRGVTDQAFWPVLWSLLAVFVFSLAYIGFRRYRQFRSSPAEIAEFKAHKDTMILYALVPMTVVGTLLLFALYVLDL